MFPHSRENIIKEVAGYLAKYGDIDVKLFGKKPNESSLSFQNKKLKDWFLSLTEVNNKISLLVTYKDRILICINYPVYLHQVNIFTLCEETFVHGDNWFPLLHQEMIERHHKDSLALSKRTDLYEYNLYKQSFTWGK